MILVLDIDGTLADVSHREHYVDKSEPDWDSFFNPTEVEKDKPILEAQDTFPLLPEAFDEIYFLTGRPESLRDTTTVWLKEHFGIDVGEADLWMREDGDERSSVFVKRDFLRDADWLDEDDVVFVDDEEKNLLMMAEFGEPVEASEFWSEDYWEELD
jgi:hypothetical protein